MFITQSAVSLQVKAPEEEWRLTLFDRTTRPPVLNRRGWMLVQNASTLVDRYDALGLSAELLFKVGQGRLDAAVVTGPDRLEFGLAAELIRNEELKLFAHDDLVRGRHFEGEIVSWAVRWYCRYGVSFRDLEQTLGERGVSVDHSKIYRPEESAQSHCQQA